MELTLLYSEEKDASTTSVVISAVSTGEVTVAKQRCLQQTRWLTLGPSVLEKPPLQVARRGVLCQLAPTLGRHVLAQVTKQLTLGKVISKTSCFHFLDSLGSNKFPSLKTQTAVLTWEKPQVQGHPVIVCCRAPGPSLLS